MAGYEVESLPVLRMWHDIRHALVSLKRLGLLSNVARTWISYSVSHGSRDLWWHTELCMKRTRSVERLGPSAKYEVALTRFPNLVSHGSLSL